MIDRCIYSLGLIFLETHIVIQHEVTDDFVDSLVELSKIKLHILLPETIVPPLLPGDQRRHDAEHHCRQVDRSLIDQLHRLVGAQASQFFG